MADMLSILIVMVFAYFAIKKYVIPRIAARRAAKNLPPVEVAASDSASGMAAIQSAVQAVAGGRSVTCFDMRFVDTHVSFDVKDDEKNDNTLIQRITYAASEMLLNASTRGDNVRLSVLPMPSGALMLYVTYTVR